MLFTTGIEEALVALDRPVVTALQVHLLAQDLFEAVEWRGEPLQRLPQGWDQRRTAVMISRLFARGALGADPDFWRGVYRILAFRGPVTAEEVACLVDPFCYVSHRSALRLHGLRRGRDTPLHLTTPTTRALNVRWIAEHQALRPEADGSRPMYPRTQFSERLRRRTLVVHETVASLPVVQIGGARAPTLGATFADTLAEPALYGGMASILRIWDRYARDHLDAIVAEVDRASAKIVKVRAGHILTERLGVETPRILVWLAFAQRGGSRRLDPEQPYAPRFSERWMLSLNVAVRGGR